MAEAPATAVQPVPRKALLEGIAAILVVVAIWTSFILIARYTATRTLTAWDLGALRLGAAALVMLPLMLRRGMAGLSLRRALALATTAGLGFPLMAYAAFGFAPVAHASVFMPGILPLWTALLALVLLGIRPSGPQAVGLGLILAAAVLLLADQGHATPGAWRGDLLFAGASFSWALYTIAARRWQVPAIQATGAVAIGAALLYLPVYALLLPKGLAATSGAEILFQAFYHGVIAVVISLFAYTRALAVLGAARTTLITALVPGLAAVLAVPLLGEPLTLAILAGLVLSTTGMLVGVLGGRG